MSFLIKRKKTYHLCWYQGKKTCPVCNGKKTVNNKSCKRCHGSGETYQRHEKSVSPDRQAALEYKVEFDRKFFRKELGLQDNKKTWASFVEEYLAYSKANKRPRTYSIDKETLESFSNFVKPFLLKDIAPYHIEQWKQEKLKKVNHTTLKFGLCQLKAALSKAVEWEFLNRNPAKNIKTAKIPLKPPRFLSKEEIKKLLSATSGQMKLIIQTFIYTGFRISELINLRWEYINFKRQEITIQAYDDFQPKDYEFRVIPLHIKLFPELYKIKKDSGYVFTNNENQKLSRRRVEENFQRLIKQSGINYCKPHDLRHTYASHLVMSGVDLRTVKELLGHSSINTTMIYSHLSKPHIKKAVGMLNYGL